EAEVLLWVSRGKTNDEIAIILGISNRTVGKHMEHIASKLNVETRTSAAAIALEVLAFRGEVCGADLGYSLSGQ
ncbi:MAG TPA: helix-turn-helix transcriptional regulator, partial [Chthoniobacterales bacterium]